tara:strand:- start:58 stop:582 length:525 start_codon:yes stop_codon:yes gene_type:complete
MGQEFFINSQELENKIRTLLPSQGGAGAGFDLSASSQIVPIIDLTESAEGSNVRADLQTAIGFSSANAFDVENQTTSVIINTGYWRVFGKSFIDYPRSGSANILHQLTDGASTKIIRRFFDFGDTSNTVGAFDSFDYNIFLEAGESLQIVVPSDALCSGVVRQLADIDGNLVNP